METSERNPTTQPAQQSTSLDLAAVINGFSQEKRANSNFKCPDPRCIYSTTHRSNLRRHMATMHTSVSRCKECCGGYFFSKKHYYQHLKDAHSNGFQCKLCDRYFKRRSILARHVDAIHCSLPHMHQCHLCSYSSSHKSNLKRHIELRHREISESETSIDSSRPTEKVKLWRPVPDIFGTSRKGSQPRKEIKRTGPTTASVRTSSTTSSARPVTTSQIPAPKDESKALYLDTSISSTSIISPIKSSSDSCVEYLHKKIRWYARH